MKSTAWTHSFAGLPLSKIALAISVAAHASDQRVILVKGHLRGVSHFVPFGEFMKLQTAHREYTLDSH